MTPRLPVLRFTARTVPGLLSFTAARVPERLFLRFLDPAAPGDPPRDVTFAGFRDLVRRAAAWLESSGVRAGDRVLLLGENSPEWPAVAIAAQLLRAEPAALFASLGAAQAEEIARRVSPRALFVSGPAQWAKLAPAAGALAAAGLRAVLAGAPLPPGALPPGVAEAAVPEALGAGAAALSLEDFEARVAAVREEDPFLLLFTSGTTGRQKGVRLPQRAILHAIDGGSAATGVTEHDVGLHLLPFGHVAGHDQFLLALGQGHSLLMIARREDLVRALSFSPSYVFSVPLVFERIRGQVLDGVARQPAPLRALLRAALEAAARVRVDGSTALRDRALAAVATGLVGRKLRAALGGRVRGLFSGGAPASEALFRFYEGLGLPLVELYGMSETAGLISSNLFHGARRARVAGLVTPDHELRFDDDGELLLRGPLLFSGYLDPADAAGSYTDDGFFRTGDRATLDADGLLRVEGRKKHLLVLSTGKKIAPEPIETALASAAPFQGAVLLGEGRPFVSAAVFVAEDELNRLAALGKDPAEELLPRAREALADFSEYEKPKRLLVIPGAPADHPALITPTLKVRREALLDLLGSRLSALYGPA
ncbi:MAG TPA: AMP-binding protein [Anaeromyxobacteraceae bacterium]|jgi:long-chain acyl-CoA synthetase|nr:AMP-binding protein [Anaeromyxobacteraceae bacterium]